MTHQELVDRAARWLRNTQKCGVVLTEFHSYCRETPDAIGWRGAMWSTLVECKTSKSDFYADKKKPGRSGRNWLAGIGRFRYYLTPKGLLTAETVKKHRPRWGLIEALPKSIRVVLKAEPFESWNTGWREIPLLYSYVRRVQQYGVELDQVQKLLSGHTGLYPEGDPDVR